MIIFTAPKINDSLNHVAYFDNGVELEFKYLNGNVYSSELSEEERKVIENHFNSIKYEINSI